MPARDRSASDTRSLSRKRRLHPLAIVFPLSSYTRPPRLSRSIRVPRWVIYAILSAALWLVDIFSVDLTVADDGSIWIERDVSRGDVAISVAAIGVGVALLVIRWWTFRWWIADDAIWTSGGIVNPWRRRVTFGHIVAVDRSSNPIRRVFGVSRIAAETTAVDQPAPDVLLGYLSRKDANLLEDVLLAKLVFEGEENETRRFEPLGVDRLGWRDLLLAGATTFHFGRALVIVYAVSLFVWQELSPSAEVSIDVWIDDASVGLGLARYAIVPVLAVITVLWLVSTAYFMASFARYRLGKHEGWLILETGVIRPSRRLIKAGAIQGLEISRSPLQRYFRAKRAMLRMRLPAYGSPPLYAMVLHPAVTDARLPALTHQIAGMDPATSAALCGKGVHPLAAGCRGAYVAYWPLRIAAGSGVMLALLLAFQPGLWWLALLLLSLAAPFAVAGWLAWRSAGWYAGDGGWLLVQRGAFTLTSTAARIDQIRYVRWSQGLFSRASATLSLAISVATSGGAGLLSRLLPFLFRPADPSLVRLRAVAASDAEKIAAASGFERSLPSDPIAG